MDVPHLFDDEAGGRASALTGFARACDAALAAVGTMRRCAGSDSGTRALLEEVEAAASLAREVDLVLARVSRAIERQSDESPGGGVARRQGHRSAADLIAAALGGTRAEAVRLIEVGRALEELERRDGPGDGPSNGPGDGPDPGDDPDPGPEPDPDDDPPPPPPPDKRPEPRHPVVAAALAAGEISAECGTQIMTMLDSLSDRVPPDRRREAERDLVSRARGLDAGRFARIVRRFKAALDVEENQRTVSRMRAARSLRVYEDREGMLVLSGRLDPETAAPVRAALDALVGDAMRRSQESVGADTRTTDQMRADALAALARHGLGCDATDLPLASVTVVVRVQESDLRAGTGHGELDGCAQPVDIATLRRMAADAEVIPAVLGGAGELLDLGRRRRLFTRAQRLALGERDGGCAFCGAPPAWTQAHHIRWWTRDGGPTDLANGVLLCGRCHHTVHEQGWEITASATEVWFVPPLAVDPARAPRRGGRARFHAPPP